MDIAVSLSRDIYREIYGRFCTKGYEGRNNLYIYEDLVDMNAGTLDMSNFLGLP